MNTYIDYLSWICEKNAGLLFAIYVITGIIYTLKMEAKRYD